MNYKYETENKDYRDFASGRVLLNAKKTTAFPIRMASEIMQHCIASLEKKESLTLYDPCCGGAHLLTAMGFIHGKAIKAIYGSDFDRDVIEVATTNLSLLTDDGLIKRENQLSSLFNTYGKESHKEALESVGRLRSMSAQMTSPIISSFTWDITGGPPPVNEKVDIVITDIPYGNTVGWQTTSSDPVQDLLGHLELIMNKEDSIIAIVSEKKETITHDRFEKVKTMKHGKRKVTMLKPK
ncbi:N-6 DNA methylase [Geomicrobium sp. JCM 19038]|uniref:N-6 DNA methylase n=1 Tax=Geomicrobium sp. JCM 19038 TaxID=1460635 RepID=UPI0005A92D70|nr:N-6 DNA methylase [Geomicrobium sp. JCM 19038]